MGLFMAASRWQHLRDDWFRDQVDDGNLNHLGPSAVSVPGVSIIERGHDTFGRRMVLLECQQSFI